MQTAGYGRDRDDDDAGFSAAREDDGPSKADMSDNWGADRKFVAADRPSGGGGFSSSRSLDPSRADDSRSWGRDRPATADDSSGSRPSSRGGGFEEREDIGPSRADTDDRWGSKGSASFSREPPARSDSGTWGASRRSSSPPPATGSRPKLALKPRTLPAPELPVPKSTASSESGTSIAEPESLSMPAPSQPTKRSNPFGAARPREDVLKEQGRDHTKEEAALAQRAADRYRSILSPAAAVSKLGRESLIPSAMLYCQSGCASLNHSALVSRYSGELESQHTLKMNGRQ